MSEVSKRDRLEATLSRFVAIGDVEGVAVVSRDGLPVASRLPGDLDLGVLCSMSAAMYAAGETALGELKRGACEAITAESNQRMMLAHSLDPQRILVALVNSGANLGLVRAEIMKTAEELRKLL